MLDSQAVRSNETDRDSEGGYVAVMTALLLVPLMIMAAFAVDIGSWYSVGANTQTAADAGALAAVAQLPDFDAAVTAAFEEAARNGFDDTDGHSQATFDNPTSYPQILVSLTSDSEVQVVIKTQADAMFGRVVLPDGIEVTRLARAQFIRPVPMGNPTSQLGGGQLNNPPDIANAFWLKAQGYCGIRANGSRGFVGFESNSMGCPNSAGQAAPQRIRDTFGYDSNGAFSWTSSTSSSAFGLNRSNRNTNGWATPYPGEPLKNDYFVAIELSPQIANNQYRVQIYRPGTCVPHLEGYTLGNTLMREGLFGGRPTVTAPRLRTRLFNVDSTLVDRWDAIFQGNIKDETLWNLTDCGGQNNDGTGWYDVGTIGGSSAEAGTHYLSYGTDNVANEIWSNAFALRVVRNNSTAICTDVAASGACPTITAVDNLPIYIHSLDEDGVTSLFSGGQTVEFYIANIAEEHAGKTLEIKLFDAGENMDYLQILQPGGAVTDFQWESTACADTGFCSAPDLAGGSASSMGNCVRPCLDVKNTVFNNNEATLTIAIPGNYSCGSDCWWKVRYVPQSSGVTDATEWSVAVTGDPVRLTD